MSNLVQLFLPLAEAAQGPALLVAGAYYATDKVIRPLLAQGHHSSCSIIRYADASR